MSLFELVSWNSQGSKWDVFWTNWIAPRAPRTRQGSADDVVGILLEAGRPPWVKKGVDISVGNRYEMDSSKSYFDGGCIDPKKKAEDKFCNGVDEVRSRMGLWFPWCTNPDAEQTNLRCSLGATVLPSKLVFSDIRPLDRDLLRPVIQLTADRGSSPVLTIFAVHLVSSRKAQDELDSLTTGLSKFIPQGTPALVVGDMNIDLMKTQYTPSANWRVLRTNTATQQSGGELDWGLLFDPNKQFHGKASAQVLQQWKTGENESDHSVMMYSLLLA